MLTSENNHPAKKQKELDTQTAIAPEETAAIRSFKSSSLQASENPEKTALVPALVIIRHEDEKKIREGIKTNKKYRVTPESHLLENMYLVSFYAPKSALAVSVRALMSNLLYLGVGREIKPSQLPEIHREKEKQRLQPIWP